jgi:hypothetical protein
MTCKSVYHNRDYNAAFNIGVRFKTLFWPHLYATTNKDIKLVTALQALD